MMGVSYVTKGSMRTRVIFIKSILRGSCKILNCVLLLAISTFLLGFIFKIQSYQHNVNELHALSYCEKSDQFQRNLHELTGKVTTILRESKVPHFLCYDALWGQMILGTVLPWRENVQVCVEQGHVGRVKNLKERFQKHRLDIEYDWNTGLYTIIDPMFFKGSVQLIVFQEDYESMWLRRTGWKYYRFRADCRDPSIGCFNPYLVDSPPVLKLAKFGTDLLPVPHYGNNIQMFHYPNTWKLWENMNGSVRGMLSGTC